MVELRFVRRLIPAIGYQTGQYLDKLQYRYRWHPWASWSGWTDVMVVTEPKAE